jgi:hypothetical protein
MIFSPPKTDTIMISNLIVAALAAYAGSPSRSRILEKLRRLFERLPPAVGNPPIEPGDWPPNCPVCGKVAAVVAGALSYFAMSALYPSEVNLTTTLVAGFLAGRLGDEVGNAIGGRLRSK